MGHLMFSSGGIDADSFLSWGILSMWRLVYACFVSNFFGSGLLVVSVSCSMRFETHVVWVVAAGSLLRALGNVCLNLFKASER